MFDNDRKKARDLSMVLTKLKIISLSRKKRKKGLEMKVKGENFGGEVGFRVFDGEKIEEDRDEEDEKEG